MPLPGFQDALQRKYDIQQQEANDRGSLLQAQAKSTTGSLASENALRNAQAFSTTQTGLTAQPLAQATIAGTAANVGEAGARSNLYNTEAGVQRLGAFSPLGSLGATLFAAGLKGSGVKFQDPTFQASPLGGLGSPGVTSTTIQNKFDPDGNVQLHAKGTAKVVKGKGKAPPPQAAAKAPGTPVQAASVMPQAAPPNGLPGLAAMLQAAMGATTVPGQGSGDKVPAMLEPGEAVVNKGGIKHIPGGRKTIAKANAKGNADKAGRGMPRKYAGGTSNVPAPGQTVTNGNWGGTPTPPPVMQPLPPTPLNGTELRRRLGLGT